MAISVRYDRFTGIAPNFICKYKWVIEAHVQNFKALDVVFSEKTPINFPKFITWPLRHAFLMNDQWELHQI